MQELKEANKNNDIKKVLTFFDDKEQMEKLKKEVSYNSNVVLDNNLLKLAIEYDKMNGTQTLALLLEKYNNFYNTYIVTEEEYDYTHTFSKFFEHIKKLSKDEINSVLDTVFNYFKNKFLERQYKQALTCVYESKNIDIIKYMMEKFNVKDNEDLNSHLLNDIIPNIINLYIHNDAKSDSHEKSMIQYTFKLFKEDIDKIITVENKSSIYLILNMDNDILRFFVDTCKNETILKELLNYMLTSSGKNSDKVFTIINKLGVNEILNNDNTTILMYACKKTILV